MDFDIDIENFPILEGEEVEIAADEIENESKVQFLPEEAEIVKEEQISAFEMADEHKVQFSSEEIDMVKEEEITATEQLDIAYEETEIPEGEEMRADEIEDASKVQFLSEEVECVDEEEVGAGEMEDEHRAEFRSEEGENSEDDDSSIVEVEYENEVQVLSEVVKTAAQTTVEQRVLTDESDSEDDSDQEMENRIKENALHQTQIFGDESADKLEHKSDDGEEQNRIEDNSLRQSQIFGDESDDELDHISDDGKEQNCVNENALRQAEISGDESDDEHQHKPDDGEEQNRKEENSLRQAQIFGEESDDEPEHESDDGEEQKSAAEQSEDNEDVSVDSRREYRAEKFDDGREWDFDVMMRQKKAERRKRPRKRDGGIDIINDEDSEISALVDAMKAATKEDLRCNQQRVPAIQKRKLLPRVKLMLLRVGSIDAMIDNGMLSAVSDWLSPLPDKSLPSLDVRTELLKMLQSYTHLEQGSLKQSGLGKAVMMLYKHPRESTENKNMAAKLIREWSRPIFQLDDDYSSLSREERVKRDLKNMPAAKRRRLSAEQQLSPTSSADTSEAGSGKYARRASIPKPSSRDYVLRPKYNVEGKFKGERKSSACSHLEKVQRDFMDRARRDKAGRAVKVSVEGKNMSL